MSFLPLILLLFLLFKKDSNNSILDIIKNIDPSYLSPILEFLGVKLDGLDLLNSEEFKCFLSGNGDIKSLIPMLLPLLKNFNKPSATNCGNFSEELKNEYFSPIKDIAGEEITSTLGNYFSNN